MPHHLIARTHGQSATLPAFHLPPHVRFPTRKQQHCRESRDSLGTALSVTVATVSLSAPPTVACREQLAHSRTVGLTTLSLTPTNIRHHHWHRGGMSKKTPPPTELQIPATVTTLASALCFLQLFDTVVWVA